MKLYISYLRFIGQTKRQERLVKVGLSNGAVVKIVDCYEGWQQHHATVEEKKVAMPIAELMTGSTEENSRTRADNGLHDQIGESQ